MMKHMRLELGLSLAVAVFAMVLSMIPVSARAAPQALGLVATNEATPLQCGDGTCTGFFSTFCLEEDRLPPGRWTAYRPAVGSDITLIVETADGRTVRLPAAAYATFKTRLDFTSILVSIAESRLAAYAPVRLSIAVGPLVSLLPEPTARDANPHTPEMMATITGPYRRTGRYFFDSGGDRSEAVAMVTRMINLLPQRGRLSKGSRRSAYRDARTGTEDRNSEAGARFEAIVGGCEALLDKTAGPSNMRQCLEYRHGAMQTKTNKEFWKALGGV